MTNCNELIWVLVSGRTVSELFPATTALQTNVRTETSGAVGVANYHPACRRHPTAPHRTMTTDCRRAKSLGKTLPVLPTYSHSAAVELPPAICVLLFRFPLATERHRARSVTAISPQVRGGGNGAWSLQSTGETSCSVYWYIQVSGRQCS